MNSRIVTVLLAVALGFELFLLAGRLSVFHYPGIHRDYEPDQPIRFSHRLHAGELGVSCQYCHYAAGRSRYAGLPPTGICMNCHRFVAAPWGAQVAENKRAEEEKRAPRQLKSDQIIKIYRSAAFPDSSQPRFPIEWVKVHNLPDFVWFDHRPHVSVGLTCQKCHGPVETMERVRQVADLNMGWCVNCHRDSNRSGVLGKPVHAPTDCATCHF